MTVQQAIRKVKLGPTDNVAKRAAGHSLPILVGCIIIFIDAYGKRPGCFFFIVTQLQAAHGRSQAHGRT